MNAINRNAIRCYAKLRAIGVSHSFSRAIAKHMPESPAPALQEVSPDRPKLETERAMTVPDGYCPSHFYS